MLTRKQSLFQVHFPNQGLYHVPCTSQKLCILVPLLCGHHDQKQPGDNEVYFAYIFISQFIIRGVWSGTHQAGQEPGGRADTEAWTVLLMACPHGLFILLPYSNQDLQPRDGTAHRELSSQSLPCRSSYGGNFSIESPSSQTTLPVSSWHKANPDFCNTQKTISDRVIPQRQPPPPWGIYMHTKMSCPWDVRLNTKFTPPSHTLHTLRVKVISMAFLIAQHKNQSQMASGCSRMVSYQTSKGFRC